MKYFRKKKLKLTATCDCNVAFKNANYIIICTPTNYNNISGIFYTSSIESTINKIKSINRFCNVVIKSTVPIGYIKLISTKEKDMKIIFSPNF